MTAATRQLGAVIFLATLAPVAGCQQKAPNLEQAQALVTQLDTAFNARDVKAFLACFDPIHRRLHAQLEARTKLILGHPTRLHRETKVLECYPRGSQAVALIKSTTTCPKRPDHRVVEHYYLGITPGPKAGSPKAMFAVALSEKVLRHVRDGKFACPACNYQFGGNDRWLTVPSRPDQAGCMESLTFISLDHDLTLEASVQISEVTLPARTALVQFLDDMMKKDWVKGDGRGKVEDWLPPYYQDGNGKRPGMLHGARCDVDLMNGFTARVHLATFGRIRYLMVLEGRPTTVRAGRAAVRELLTSFRLLRTDRTPAQVFALAVKAHTGNGQLNDNVYANSTHKLKLAGPKGWKGRVSPCEHLFRVRFQCERTGASMIFEALEPPVGFQRWTRKNADMVFERWLRQSKVGLTKGESAWHDSGERDGFQWREVEARCAGSNSIRVLRMAMRSTVLVMIEGTAGDSDSVGAIRRAMASVTLLR